MSQEQLIQQFVAAAREAHRTHDVQRRNQLEENIREVASRRVAKKIIAAIN